MPTAPRAARLPPTVPASAGALIRDAAGRLLVLRPTYKSGWTLPGGEIEADGESPWDACRREILEECGLVVVSGRLACVDTRPARPGRPGGLRFLFDCGVVPDADLARVVVPAAEISEHRLVPPDEALSLLRTPVSRRVAAVLDAGERFVYLENGRPAPGVR